MQSVENVFLWVIEKQREQHIRAVNKVIEAFDINKPIQELGKVVTEKCFETLKKVNPKVIQFIEGRLIKRDQFSSRYFHFIDPIAEALFKNSKKLRQKLLDQSQKMNRN